MSGKTTINNISTWYRRADFPPAGTVCLLKQKGSTQLERVLIISQEHGRSVTYQFVDTGEVKVTTDPTRFVPENGELV